MARRNIWEHEETVAMLSIMEERNCLRHFDGKIYKNAEIYRKIEREMIGKGFVSKTDKQIETRWKNLKKNYISAKKNNNRSGSDRQLCPFYEELDRLLGCRPSVNTISSGIDTSRTDESGNVEILEDPGVNENYETPIEPVPIETTSQNSSSSGCTPKVVSGKGSYAKCIDKLGETIKKAQDEINKEFLKNQKELINYEFNLYSEKEKEFEKRFNESTRQILEDNTNKFLTGLGNLLSGTSGHQTSNTSTSSQNNDIRDFIMNFSGE